MDHDMSKQEALENVLIMAERLAFLHYAFAKTIERYLPRKKADEAILEAIDEYGKLNAKSTTKRIQEQNLEPVLINFRKGKDLPSVGWRWDPIDKPGNVPCGKISKISKCPLAEIWKQLGEDGQRLGRLYCYVDQAKFRAYGKGYECVHDKNILDGDDYCIIRVTTED